MIGLRRIAAAILILLTVPATAEPPSLDIYGKLPGYEMAAMSPSGNRTALIASVDGERQLIVLENDKVITRAAVGDQKLRSVSWAGENHVLIRVSYAVPLGAHIRRMNPRDTAVNIQRRKMLRRGATYGPALPEGAPEDGVERGIAAFVICASLVRQFEFAQNVWVNDPNFHELGNERDPMIGAQDGSYDITIPKRPIRRKIKGLPAFTTVKGGAYFFLPSL